MNINRNNFTCPSFYKMVTSTLNLAMATYCLSTETRAKLRKIFFPKYFT